MEQDKIYYIACDENDEQLCGSYTSNDGGSLCYVKGVQGVVISKERYEAFQQSAKDLEAALSAIKVLETILNIHSQPQGKMVASQMGVNFNETLSQLKFTE